jgi:hypothetical protein
MINIGAALPAITQKVTINGNTGGAMRVELRGPGGEFQAGLNGLTIQASGTVVENLVINNFPVTGINVTGSNVTIRGNYIGTNAAGTAAVPNGDGIYGNGAGLTIGGNSSAALGGPCTGDCNLISGNSAHGIQMQAGSANLVVTGNLIGTDVTGNGPLGNGFLGIWSGGEPGLKIGGSSPGEGNVVSGNGTGGVLASGAGAEVRRNLIGTNADGDAAIPNGIGLEVRAANAAIVQQNLISGNNSHGLFIVQTVGAQVRNNLIGVAANGTTPMGNGGNGVWIATATDNDVGTANGADANTIAFNTSDGVEVNAESAPTTGNSIRVNSIHDNGGLGINNVSGGNNEPAPPVITAVGSASGTSCHNCTIDVYSDAADEGASYHGSTTANASGDWSFSGSVGGPNVTATSTDSSGNTSEFSAPFSLSTPTPTPSPSPSPSPTSTATPTPTAIPTPSPTHTPGAVLGDANCDRKVDLSDVTAVLSSLGGVPPGAPCPSSADANCNEHIDADDALRILAFEADVALTQPSGCAGVGSST